MAVLEVKDLCKSYGAQTIFEDASVSLSTEQKIGMIGRNGAGKSTLCKIILGEEEADSGQIIKGPGLRLSYLEQHDPFQAEETAADFLVRYTGREEWECGIVAARFRIDYEQFHLPIKKLSGGYQTRVKLAAMLLQEPNFLILDEPSNYLDLNTLILLENFLLDYKGGYLVVSHDREFLKKTCEYTLEAENGDLRLYPGDVEEYLIFKEEQKRQAVSINKNIEAKQRQLQRFMDRFGAKASKATQAKAKEKHMKRLQNQKIEVEQELSNVRIRIPQVSRSNGTALLCEELAIGYPEKLVADRIDAEVDRGAHIAVLGENGEGKTTFLRTIAGDLESKGGRFRWSGGTKIAYYAQHVFATLDPRDDIYTHLERTAGEGVTRQDILNIAGSFLFKGDDVDKKISVLSGGEKARTVLAGLLLTKSQVLLLDEPTNHLDFETVEALGSSLKKFAGTIFFISHDRTFVNLLSTGILDVKDGKINRYPGTYEDYVDFLERQAREDINAEDAKQTTQKNTKEKKKALNKQVTKELKQQIKEIKQRIKKCEEDAARYKLEKETIYQEFMDNASAYSRERQRHLEKATKLLEKEENLWIKLSEELSELEKQLT